MFKYFDKNFPNTVNYILESLSKNRTISRNIILKEDFILTYNKTVNNRTYRFNYTFESLPDVILGKLEKVTIHCTDLFHGREIGYIKTNFLNFLDELKEPKDVKKLITGNLKRDSVEDFINKSKNKYGDNTFDYSKVVYVNNSTKIILTCNKCGKTFETTPTSHLISNYGCPNCAKEFGRINRSDTLGIFIGKCYKLYGDLYKIDTNSVYINRESIITAINTKTNEVVINKARAFLDGYPEPTENSMSIGESRISRWLSEHNFSFNQEVIVRNILNNSSKYVKIDFELYFLNKRIWIEFNGSQHYKYTEIFHKTVKDFEKQVFRDKAVKEYCNNNDIILFEIPYTYLKNAKLENLLESIFINKNINPIIEYPIIE